ncbi:hypothetical protein GGI17_001666 [Coemansia sp. S146]|nr:hypothetical protein GGI17_001666 [Coemansia sp. S146]
MASPAEQSVATDEYGDDFIKETDDIQRNRQMGVGACALHPCLTRQTTTILDDGAEEIAAVAPAIDAGERDLAGLLEQHSLLREEREEDRKAHSPSAARKAGGGGGGGGARASALSDSNALSVSTASMSAGQARLTQKRMELTMLAGLRPSGADTPTVDLVQTAVSVREVSKLIGRTVVQVSNVRRIMIVTKPNDTSLVRLTRDLAVWLVEHPADEGALPMVVYVEAAIARHSNFNLARVRAKCPAAQAGLQQWTPELCARSPELFDFVVTLGGDGTVLYTSWLFQKTVPPIIPFHLGSLGFLTVFDHRHARRVLDSAIRAGVRINLRMRFTCTVYRLADAVDPQHANVLVDAADCNRVIDHALATNGLQSCDELAPKQKPAPRSFSGSAKRLAHSIGSHVRRRSSATAPGSAGSSGAEGDGDQQAQSSRSSLRHSIARHHTHMPPPPPPMRKHHSHSAPRGAAPAARPASSGGGGGGGGASSSSSPPPPPPPPPPAAPRSSTLNESEWDDVPRAYQQRVRKVWKRDSTFQVMNEVVVDRGPSPYLSQIELYGDGNHLTTVEADGLCLATPTGSTAYSLAAGGSLVHPEIPAILVTPICAHTLSFRPMLLPDSMVVRVVLPPDSRNTAWASFDGRHRIELRRGDHIQITASKYPLPTVCASQSQTQDWMSSLSRCLNWNERKRQKKFGDITAADPAPHAGGGGASDDGGDEDDNDDNADDIVAGRLRQSVSSAYPLKIIAPHAGPAALADALLHPAVSYLMSYGGGIVHGDRIHVDVRVGSKCALVLLTQGSTKVFRSQPSPVLTEQTYQTIVIDVEPDALLCLLPDPVTCFKDAMYNQRQLVTLHSPASSVVLLDWMTSGRMSRGERWDFAKYFSVNVIRTSDRIIIRDALLLQDSFATRMEPIDAFALILVLGPAVAEVAQTFREEHKAQRIKPFRPNATHDHASEEQGILWSVSEIDEHGVCGVAVRAAGPSTEELKDWIKRRLVSLKPTVGDCVWSMYANSF